MNKNQTPEAVETPTEVDTTLKAKFASKKKLLIGAAVATITVAAVVLTRSQKRAKNNVLELESTAVEHDAQA